MTQNSKTELFFFKFYFVDEPAIMVSDRILDEVCDATVSAFWVVLNNRLDCLKHLCRQLDSSILLNQCTKPARK
jgi:hypothetical protein